VNRDHDALAEQLDELDRVFAALAHASRRHILGVLKARGSRVRAGDIARRFACSWPTTTRHLRVLENAGLVRIEQEGRERWYVLEAKLLQRVAGGWLAAFPSAAGRSAPSERSSIRDRGPSGCVPRQRGGRGNENRPLRHRS
jgi:DNA-binding transcriptional ArsR family regulator